MDASKNDCTDITGHLKNLDIDSQYRLERLQEAVGPRHAKGRSRVVVAVGDCSLSAKRRADCFSAPGGASCATTVKRFLDLPYTIREKVLELVLAGRDFTHVSYTRLKQAHPRYTRGYGHLNKCSVGLERGATGIFLACRQIRNEAARILYGSTHFSSFDASGFREQFIPCQIGPLNASCIRELTLGVPESLKVDPETALPNFLDLFCDAMPNLQCLEFTTRFRLFAIVYHNPHKGELCPWDKEQRAMLNTAAWVTLRHTKLKKAIWLAKSGEDEDEDQQVCFFVKILAVDMKHTMRSFTTTMTFMDPDEERTDMILDSNAIRRQGWDSLPYSRAEDYGLPEDAESSEINAVANNPDDLIKYLSSKKKQQGSKSRVKAIKGLASWR